MATHMRIKDSGGSKSKFLSAVKKSSVSKPKKPTTKKRYKKKKIRKVIKRPRVSKESPFQNSWDTYPNLLSIEVKKEDLLYDVRTIPKKNSGTGNKQIYDTKMISIRREYKGSGSSKKSISKKKARNEGNFDSILCHFGSKDIIFLFNTKTVAVFNFIFFDELPELESCLKKQAELDTEFAFTTYPDESGRMLYLFPNNTNDAVRNHKLLLTVWNSFSKGLLKTRLYTFTELIPFLQYMYNEVQDVVNVLAFVNLIRPYFIKKKISFERIRSIIYQDKP
jgi:hypothetical protein